MKNDIEFEYIEITSDIYKLKEFLKLRDAHEAFDLIKKHNNVGIPVAVINDERICFNINKKLVEEIRNEEKND